MTITVCNYLLSSEALEQNSGDNGDDDEGDHKAGVIKSKGLRRENHIRPYIK